MRLRWWLFLGRVISGVTSAGISSAFAYVADVTPPEARAGRFGMLGAAFGVGFVLGPALGGLTHGIDLRLPFWIAAAFSLVNWLYGFFVLPESLPPDRREPFSWRRAKPGRRWRCCTQSLGSSALPVLPSSAISLMRRCRPSACST